MARGFDGINQSIDGDGVGPVFDQDQMTLFLWIFPQPGADRRNGLKFQSSPANAGGWGLDTHQGNWRVRFEYPFSGGTASWQSFDVSPGFWQSVSITYDRTSSTHDPAAVLNGSPLALPLKTAPSGTALTGWDSFRIGYRANWTYSPTRWAEIGLWNRILGQRELQVLHAGYAPAHFPEGLVWYLPLVRSSQKEPRGGRVPTTDDSIAMRHPRIVYPTRRQLLVSPSGDHSLIPRIMHHYRSRRIHA